MDRGEFKKLNPIHVIFLIENVMIGLGLLSLPHDMSEAGYSQWVIPILLGIVVQICLIPMVMLGRLYPNEDLYSIGNQLLGHFFGKIITFIIIFYCIVQISTVSEGYLRLVQTVTLPQQSITLPLIALYAPMVYITFGGIKSVARFCIIAFWATTWLVYYEQWALTKGHFIHILPLFDFSFKELLHASNGALPSYFGFELLLIYFPYIQRQQCALLHASIGVWLTVPFYVGVSLTSVIYFSRWQLENLRFPVLNLFKAVELSFIERIENFGVSMWVFLILSTLCAYLWAAQKGWESIVNKKSRGFVVMSAVISLLIILLPFSYELKQKLYSRYNTYIGYGFILYPSILLLVHLIRKGRKTSCEKPPM